MPSAKILSEKQAYVADLKAKFESAVSGCVVAYGGINVENDTKLRKELREAGVDYMVVKNTMLRLAVKGTALEGLVLFFLCFFFFVFVDDEFIILISALSLFYAFMDWVILLFVDFRSAQI